MLQRCSLLPAALLALAFGTACTHGDPRPNLLLIVVDTLRADHLGAYGHARDTSPRIDALAASAVRFERAYATAPWTLPSVSSILSGLYPSGHGAMRIARALPESVDTVAERLQRAGYRSGGVVSHVFLEPHLGLSQGFEAWETRYLGEHHPLSTRGVTDAALAMLRDFAGGDRPFFLFVHYFDPHYPYQAHPEYGYAGARFGMVEGGMIFKDLMEMRKDLTEDEVEFVRALYDGEIRHTDEGIGRLLDALSQHGLLEDTLIALTADHGEEFMEHGWIGHTISLRDPVLRVPLLIRPPGPDAAGRVVENAVSLVGLAPTLLELLGVSFGSEDFQGRSFAPLVRGEGGPDPGPVYAEVDYWLHYQLRTQKRALVDPPYKLIQDRLRDQVSLFDLDRDPGETRDLAAQEPERVAAMLAALEARSRSASSGEATDAADAGTPAVGPDQRRVPEQQERLLRELGYVE